MRRESGARGGEAKARQAAKAKGQQPPAKPVAHARQTPAKPVASMNKSKSEERKESFPLPESRLLARVAIPAMPDKLSDEDPRFSFSGQFRETVWAQWLDGRNVKYSTTHEENKAYRELLVMTQGNERDAERLVTIAMATGYLHLADVYHAVFEKSNGEETMVA
ncbi:MAG: hypothetical protein WCG61_04535 [Chlorobium sp.]